MENEKAFCSNCRSFAGLKPPRRVTRSGFCYDLYECRKCGHPVEVLLGALPPKEDRRAELKQTLSSPSGGKIVLKLYECATTGNPFGPSVSGDEMIEAILEKEYPPETL